MRVYQKTRPIEGSIWPQKKGIEEGGNGGGGLAKQCNAITVKSCQKLCKMESDVIKWG